jgi:hypothetical protein
MNPSVINDHFGEAQARGYDERWRHTLPIRASRKRAHPLRGCGNRRGDLPASRREPRLELRSRGAI